MNIRKGNLVANALRPATGAACETLIGNERRSTVTGAAATRIEAAVTPNATEAATPAEDTTAEAGVTSRTGTGGAAAIGEMVTITSEIETERDGITGIEMINGTI